MGLHGTQSFTVLIDSICVGVLILVFDINRVKWKLTLFIMNVNNIRKPRTPIRPEFWPFAQNGLKMAPILSFGPNFCFLIDIPAIDN